jgi:hypothetical protein|tara:strand:- start:2566 stop:3051 length:486 start_codon:yes stop_codon:yes gene_type:complete
MDSSRIEVFDGVLAPTQFNRLQSYFESSHFPWYFKPGIDYKDDGKFQFTHNIYDNFAPQSSVFDEMNEILSVLNANALIRVKANLQVRTKKIEENSYHVDYKDCKTAIYYVNTNNGCTLFETGEKIESVANRLVVFDSNLNHAGSSCTDRDTRIVLNFNYF